MSTILFGAVGDISLGDHPLCAGFGTHSVLQERNPSEIFQHVAELFHSTDILFGNLECTLSERDLEPGDYHSVQMRGQPAYVEGLQRAGFDVLNLANNHSLQHGEQAFRETQSMLAAADIDVCGLAKTSSQAQLCVRESNGLRVGFLGYSLRPRQYFTQPPLYAEGSPAGMIDDVERAKADCDVLVVSAHWGDEFIDRPSPEEVRLARGLIDAGANLVIGHHPHVLRGMERYHGGVIVYSLGNFVCDMLWDPILRETAVFRCKLGKTGVVDPQLVPAWINEWSQPTIADSTRANLIETRLRKLSRELEHGDLESESSYLEAAAAAHAKIRKKSHFYFVRNIYRYPPSLLGQNIANFLRNRVSEIKAAAAR